MRNYRYQAAAASLLLIATAGSALAADEEKKPAAPTFSEVLESSGLTATGYVDATYSYVSAGANGQKSTDSNTFALNQAAVTIAKQPASGFGGLVNIVGGTEAPSLPGGTGTSSGFDLLQAYLQYASGKVTVIAGKFVTLAGAEVVAPTGNTNVTRSLLFAYEPVTHTGVRLTYAVTDKASLIIGGNNGWNAETNSPDKTVELGVTLTPSKAFSFSGAGYYGKTGCISAAQTTNCMLIDLVGTWNATDKLSIVLNADIGQQQKGQTLAADANWYGVAGYVNYAINDLWRLSVRGEYYDDHNGFLTGSGTKQKLSEGTFTLGYAPAKNFELRFEGRYDTVDTTGKPHATQGWVQGLYKF